MIIFVVLQCSSFCFSLVLDQGLVLPKDSPIMVSKEVLKCYSNRIVMGESMRKMTANIDCISMFHCFISLNDGAL